MKSVNRRILVVDDNRAIHDDFRKIFSIDEDSTGNAFETSETALFGVAAPAKAAAVFELEFASQGEEALELVRRSLENGRPYAMAFMDMAMPPGWDGIETTTRIRELDPNLQVAICTAYSDYTWQQMLEKLTRPGQFLVLGKPFESTAVRQIAMALTEKWNLARAAERSHEDLDRLVTERTRELEAANARLEAQMNERIELERRLQHAHGVGAPHPTTPPRPAHGKPKERSAAAKTPQNRAPARAFWTGPKLYPKNPKRPARPPRNAPASGRDPAFVLDSTSGPRDGRPERT